MSRCLITGASGFLGRYALEGLRAASKDIVALGRKPADGVATIVADLASASPVEVPEGIKEVYHVAGLAHTIARNPAEEQRFFAVNRDGTERLLAAFDRTAKPDSFTLVSTVAVYGREQGELLDEDTSRAAQDPYGVSKREAEDLVARWCARHGVRCAILRLPLVIGRNAPGNLRAMTRAIESGRYFGVDGGRARRSIVWAGDAARILPLIAQTGGTFHLTDGVHPSFAQIEERLAAALARRRPAHLPRWAAAAAASAGDAIERVSGRPVPLNTRVLTKMTCSLTFSDARARALLGWNPSSALDHVEELVEPVRSAAC